MTDVRLTLEQLIAHYAGTPAVRLTQMAAEVHAASESAVRTTMLNLSLHHAATPEARLTSQSLDVHHAATPHARATYIWLDVWVPVTQPESVINFTPPSVVVTDYPHTIDETAAGNGGDSGDGSAQEVQALPKEWIPYRPFRPNEEGAATIFGSELADSHIRELMPQLRETHVMHMTGDTDQPYEYILQIEDKARYSLGSHGRFRHDDYGILQGVYVEFREMNGVQAGGPVGFVATSDPFKWQVTNDISKSSASRALGVLPGNVPESGQFGWVLTEGPNLLQLKVKEGEELDSGTPLVWSGDGEVSGKTDGVALARHFAADAVAAKYDPGQAAVKVAGAATPVTTAAVAGLQTEQQALAAAQSNLGAQIAALQSQLAAGQGGTEAQYAALTQQLATLRARLDDAIYNSKRDDDGIGDRVSVETDARIAADAALSSLIAELQAQIDAIGGLDLANLQAQVTALQGLVNSNYAALAALISSLGDRVAQLEYDARAVYMPATLGDIPPTFVQLDDGSLVYTRVE